MSSDSEDEGKLVKHEKVNNSLIKGGVPDSMFRAHIDPITYIPLPDHSAYFKREDQKILLSESEYKRFHNTLKKEGKQYIAASVVKNPQVFTRNTGEIISEHDLGITIIPPVESAKDVHHSGLLCAAQVRMYGGERFGKTHFLLLTPISKMKITEWIEPPTPIGKVRIEEVLTRNVRVEDLDIEQKAALGYIQKLLLNVPMLSESAQRISFALLSGNVHMIIMCALRVIAEYEEQVSSQVFNEEANRLIHEIVNENNLTLALQKVCEALGNISKKEEIILKIEKKGQAIYEETEREKEKNKGNDSFGKVTDERIEIAKKFRKNIEGKKLPPIAQKKFEEEIAKYLSVNVRDPESLSIRTYLEYISSMPWGISSTDSIEIDRARKILDEGHYGMNDIKQRILEFLAVGKLHGKVHGKIVCFVGPPGVGKTSIGASIAKAINRKFYRIAVGGDRDSSTMKGFRRTYVGAIPGKIVQALRNVQVDNPVILIDEIDKMGGRSIHGDPSSVLLEILDPEQNPSFTDDYLDTPIDLSKVLFLCTANTTYTIPKPLLDRMEIIQVSGYTHTEKMHILEKYLKPQAYAKSGIQGREKDYKIAEDANKRLIEDFCREPGVRSLQRAIKRVTERLALKLIKGERDIVVDSSNLEYYVGHPPFHSQKIYPVTPIGVSCGLAYSELGGSIMYIETRESAPGKEEAEKKGPGRVRITGSLGDVMKESVEIAHTFTKNFLMKNLPDSPASDYLSFKEIHIHLPEGAVPKEGPSGGVAITTSLMSLALNKPVLQNIAMTGEITLQGKVLPIGGVKEKVLAAQREGIKRVILPAQNKKDYEKLPDFIKKDAEVNFVDNYSEVFNILFPDVKIA